MRIVNQPEILIGGAGIIGLATGLELALAGFSVHVIERGEAMRESSWAAAGMLPAQDPADPPELAELSLLSQSLYPGFLDRVAKLSKKNIPLRTERTLRLSGLHESFPFPASEAWTPVTIQEAKKQVPGLNPGSRSLLWLKEASLDPRDLCVSLPLAAAKAGVVIEENNQITAVASRPEGVTVTTTVGKREAGEFINCCGSWSSSITGAFRDGSQQEQFVVGPCKGQMIAARLEDPPPLDVVLRAPDLFLVPRGDGRVVIGATEERAGFDRGVNPEAIDHLMAQAVDLWPPVGQAVILDSWTGLRPVTADRLPFIGHAPAAHCWVATGHFRSGILLAPATAQIVCLLIQGKTPPIDLGRFRPDRRLPAMVL